MYLLTFGYLISTIFIVIGIHIYESLKAIISTARVMLC